jgi:hypothetical protein
LRRGIPDNWPSLGKEISQAFFSVEQQQLTLSKVQLFELTCSPGAERTSPLQWFSRKRRLNTVGEKVSYIAEATGIRARAKPATLNEGPQGFECGEGESVF